MIRKINRSLKVIPFIAIIPYLLLTFFARPAADDLTPNFYMNKYGILRECWLSYLHSSGRFFSMSLFLFFTSFRFVFAHYFLIPLLLFLLFVYAFYRLFKIFNKYYLHFPVSNIRLLGGAILVLLVYLSVLPDVASSFYWMAAAVTYQVPIILFIFFVGTYTVFLNTGRWWYWVVSTTFIFFIFGSNEIFIFLLFPLLSLFSFFLFTNRNPYRWHTLLLTFIGLVSVSIVLFSPAGDNRAATLNKPPGMMYVILASITQVLINALTTFNTPLFWTAFLITVLKTSGLNIPLKYLKGMLFLAAIIPLLSLLACFVVFRYKDNGLPGRAMNDVSFFFLIAAFLAAAGLGFKLKDKLSNNPGSVITQIMLVFFFITVFTNFNYATAVKDILSGIAFSSVYDKRVSIVKEAAGKGLHSVSLKEYNYYWNDFVETNIPVTFKKPFRKLVDPYPRSIFICDDLAEKDWDNGFAEYYNMDTIIVNNRIVVRHSIVKGFRTK